MFFKTSVKEQGRMTRDNFFRHSPSNKVAADGSVIQEQGNVSELIAGTSSVVVGGISSILRQKTLKIGSVSTKPLTNDI